jgi:hypothetical protein
MIMEVRHYEYRVVQADGLKWAEDEINKLAAEGFRVIKCAGAGTEFTKTWMWTLEREVLPDHPYR